MKKCYDCLSRPIAGTANDSTFHLACLISEFSKSFLFCFLRPSTRITLSNRTVSTLSAYDYKEMFVQNEPKQRKCFVISNGTVRLGGNWECFSKTGKVQCFTTVPMETGASTVCTSCSSFLMPDAQQLLITALLWITSGCQRNLKAHYLLSSSSLNCDADLSSLCSLSELAHRQCGCTPLFQRDGNGQKSPLEHWFSRYPLW